MENDNLSTFYDIFVKLKSDRENAVHFFSMESSSFMEKRRKSFAQMHRDIQVCYNNLVKRGVNYESTAALNIGNSYYFFVCDFALILLGAQTVLHSKNDPVELLKKRLEQFHVDYVISEKPIPGLEKHGETIELNDLFNPDTPMIEVKKYSWGERDVSIVFSSGTSGIPKGLGVSQRGSVETGKWFFQWMEFTPHDKFLIYLPLASYQQRFLIWSCLMKDVDIILAEDKTLFKALQEFKPTILLAPPNFYFNLYRMNTGSRFKQAIRKILPYNKRNKLLRFIAGVYTYKPLYEALGGKTRYLITGMAPIDFRILEHFRDAYLDICQIYGQTEIGMIACNKTGANKLGTVGKPIIPVHLAEEDNEIITNSDFPTIQSYHLEQNGKIERTELGKRIPTGDVGIIDEDGYLTIKGRKNETLILKSGIKINPALVENKIKARIGNIEEVLVFKPDGQNRKDGLNAVVLVKSADLDFDTIKEAVENEHEIRQSSEKVGIFFYLLKKEDRRIMYTENNKFSRVRATEHLKKNYQELKRIN
jgi:long-chain acyl-CoA synthetase